MYVGLIFTKLSALVHFETRIEYIRFWGKKVKVQGHSGSSVLEIALSGLVSATS